MKAKHLVFAMQVLHFTKHDFYELHIIDEF